MGCQNSSCNCIDKKANSRFTNTNTVQKPSKEGANVQMAGGAEGVPKAIGKAGQKAQVDMKREDHGDKGGDGNGGDDGPILNKQQIRQIGVNKQLAPTINDLTFPQLNPQDK